jgi:hypothetical protein
MAPEPVIFLIFPVLGNVSSGSKRQLEQLDLSRIGEAENQAEDD